MKGWIKLHRKIQEHWIWQDDRYLRYWLIILLNVNHEEKKFPVGNDIYTCYPGESFRSINNWTDLFSCSKPTTIKFFKMLQNDGMIFTKTLGKGNRRKHLLTVANWQDFQETFTENFTENKPETLPKINPNVDRKCTSNKNEKNVKNEKKKDIFDFKKSVIDLGVDKNVFSDWLKVRRKKGAVDTETAFKLIKTEIEKSGLPANECIKMAAGKSWQGFKASWIENENKINGKSVLSGNENHRSTHEIFKS